MRDTLTAPPPPASHVAAPAGPLPPVAHRPGWATLLEWCYRRTGLDLPRMHLLKDSEVPPPYRRLLVHSSDMTPTLEGFFQQRPGLTVLSRELREDSYLREVLLTLGERRRPFLYGAIRIFLVHLPPAARQRVLAEQDPLGHILQSEGIPHLSWPQNFFRAEPDPHLAGRLEVPATRDLYGRRNVLLDGSRHLLAEVIEVLGAVRETSPKSEVRNPKSEV